jgi:hypothetical protein
MTVCGAAPGCVIAAGRVVFAVNVVPPGIEPRIKSGAFSFVDQGLVRCFKGGVDIKITEGDSKVT